MQPFFKATCPVLYNQNIQPSFLRKFTAILLVITFAQPCDCMKIISQSKAVTDQSPVPLAHNHLHIDESYLLPFSITRLHYHDHGIATYFLTPVSPLEDGMGDKPYRPPRLIG
jgi:hypothetical protein